MAFGVGALLLVAVSPKLKYQIYRIARHAKMSASFFLGSQADFKFLRVFRTLSPR